MFRLSKLHSIASVLILTVFLCFTAASAQGPQQQKNAEEKYWKMLKGFRHGSNYFPLTNIEETKPLTEIGGSVYAQYTCALCMRCVCCCCHVHHTRLTPAIGNRASTRQVRKKRCAVVRVPHTQHATHVQRRARGANSSVRV